MKGLLIKDLLALRGQGKLFLLMLVFYSIFGIAMKNPAMTITFVVVICAMLPITCMSYDESCKWDRFALTMPVSRRDMVLSKYLLFLLLNVGMLIVALPLSLVTACMTA